MTDNGDKTVATEDIYAWYIKEQANKAKTEFTHEFLKDGWWFELKSAEAVRKPLETEHGLNNFWFLDSEPKYIMSCRSFDNMMEFLLEHKIKLPQLICRHDREGGGKKVKYLFKTVPKYTQKQLKEYLALRKDEED